MGILTDLRGKGGGREEHAFSDQLQVYHYFDVKLSSLVCRGWGRWDGLTSAPVILRYDKRAVKSKSQTVKSVNRNARCQSFSQSDGELLSYVLLAFYFLPFHLILPCSLNPSLTTSPCTLEPRKDQQRKQCLTFGSTSTWNGKEVAWGATQIQLHQIVCWHTFKRTLCSSSLQEWIVYCLRYLHKALKWYRHKDGHTVFFPVLDLTIKDTGVAKYCEKHE